MKLKRRVPFDPKEVEIKSICLLHPTALAFRVYHAALELLRRYIADAVLHRSRVALYVYYR